MKVCSAAEKHYSLMFCVDNESMVGKDDTKSPEDSIHLNSEAEEIQKPSETVNKADQIITNNIFCGDGLL